MNTGSLIQVMDNSGIKVVKLLQRSKKNYFITLGEILLVSCRKVNPKKKWQKGQKVKCLLVHIKRPILRECFAIKCEFNQVVVLKEGMKVECKATRVKGILFSEMRNTNVNKILSLGDYIL